MKFTADRWLWRAGRRAIRTLVVLMVVAGLLGVESIRRACAAPISTTTVQGTVYLANGQPGAGMLHLSWPAFTTADGQAIVADSTDVTIAADGFLSVNLAPNLGAMPGGLYYTAVYYMNDGSVSTQYWVVPAAAQATLAQVQAQVMPAAQAVQAVNKAYVDQAISRLSQTVLTGAGGTLTGPLYLNGDPTQALQAADKHYVDLTVSQAGSAIVNTATPGQIAYYAANGTSISGMSMVPVASGGTGATTPNGALQNLGGVSASASSPQSMTGTLNLSGPYDSNTTNPNQAATAQNVKNVAPRSVKEFGAKGNGIFSDFKMSAGSNIVTLVDVCCGYNFAPGDVGKLISLPKVDSDGATLYTTITGYTDSTHVTVAKNAANSFDGTGTFVNQAVWGTDDSAAISAAISAAASASAGAGSNRYGGGAVYFPCGIYPLASPIVVASSALIGEKSGCVSLLDMTTTAHDAVIEASYGRGSNWLRANGLYWSPSFNNHTEIGTCSGATCSPALPSAYVQGLIKGISVFANKYAYWAVSLIAPTNFLIEDLTTYGGSAGCFYNLNNVQATFTNLSCTSDRLYGYGSPVDGVYFDGSGPGQGVTPAKLLSPQISYATDTAMTFNYVSGASIEDAQISANARSINILPTSGGIIFVNPTIETFTSPDVIGGGSNVFIGGGLGSHGVTVSGTDNKFINVIFGGGQTLTISGEGNSFDNVRFPNNFTIVDTSKTTSYTNRWNFGTSSQVYNEPTNQQSLHRPNDSNVEAVSAYVSGTWKMISANTPYRIAATSMSGVGSWKAIFIGSWFYYGTQTALPPILELTDTNNTVSVGGRMLTFGINANGEFSVQTTTADTWLGFSGWVYVLPRSGTAGSGGTESMQLAGDLKTPSITLAGGTAMTANHGTGTSVQHSDGTGTSGNLARFGIGGDVVDGPAPPSGAIVGTTDTQTLTNKSIAGSEINSGTVGATYGGTGLDSHTATGIAQVAGGTWSVSTALANGTTATTQSAGDSSTKVATTAYVALPGAIAPTTVTASGIVTGGNDTTRTTASTISTTGFTSTGLVLPTVPANTTKNGRCIVLWQMSSTSYSATFGIGMSNAPTGLWGGSSVTYAAAGTSNWLAFSQTATAATAVSTAATAGAANTTYRAEIDFTLQTGVSNTVAVTLYGQVSNSSATLTIQPGSACYWLP